MFRKPTPFFYGYIIVAACFIMYFISMAVPTYGVTVLNARMVEATGMSASTVGIGVSIATLLQGLSAPVVGSMIRKNGVRLPYIIGTVLVVIGCFLMSAYVPNEIFFILYYGVLMGAGMGFGGILSLQSSINAWFDKRKALAMGIAMSAGGFAGLILPLVLGAVADRSSWQGGWRFAAFACLFSAAVGFIFMVNKPEDMGEVPDGKKASERFKAAEAQANKEQAENIATVTQTASTDMPLNEVYRSRSFFALAFNVGAKWALYYAFTGHVVIFLMQNGVDRTTAALAISAFSIASLVGRLLIGTIPETVITPKMNNAFGTIIFTAGMVALLLMPLTVTTICVFTAIMGFTFGTTMIGFPIMVSRNFGAGNFPVVNAKMALIQNVLGAVGPLVVGFIATALSSYHIAYWIFIALSFVSGLGVLTIKDRQQ